MTESRIAHEEYKGHPLLVIYTGERRALSFGRRKAQAIIAAFDGIKAFAAGSLEASKPVESSAQDKSSEAGESAADSKVFVGKGARGNFLEVRIPGGAPMRFAEDKARALIALESDVRNFCEGLPLINVENQSAAGEFFASLDEYKGNKLIEIHGNWNKRFSFGKRKAEILLSEIEGIAKFSREQYDDLPELPTGDDAAPSFRVDEGKSGKAVFELEISGGAPMRFQQPKAELVVTYEQEIRAFAES